MAVPDTKEKWTGKINEVTIGATKDEGGSRGKTITVGGQSTLPFLNFEGEIPNKAVIAGFVSDTPPDWPDTIKNAIGSEVNSPVEWAQKNIEDFKCDLLSLKLIGADPNVNELDAWGRPLVELSYDSPAASSIWQIAEKYVGRVGVPAN